MQLRSRKQLMIRIFGICGLQSFNKGRDKVCTRWSSISCEDDIGFGIGLDLTLCGDFDVVFNELLNR